MIESQEFFEGGVEVSLCGRITSGELKRFNQEIINHGDFESLRYQLWIVHDVEDVVLSALDMRELAEQDRKAGEKNPHVKVAIVSDSPLVFGMGRMYEAFYGDGPWETRVFYDAAEAREWIES